MLSYSLGDVYFSLDRDREESPLWNIITLASDILKAVRALLDVRFDDTQAEAEISTVGDAIGGNATTKATSRRLNFLSLTNLDPFTNRFGRCQPASSL